MADAPGDRIRRARRGASLSQRQLARLIGSARASVGAYEGRVRLPTLSALYRLGHALCCPPDWLACLTDSPPPPRPRPMSEKQLRVAFSRNLRAARLRAGLSRKRAAALAHTTEATWCRWEGRVCLPRWEQLAGLCAALGVKVSELVAGA